MSLAVSSVSGQLLGVGGSIASMVWVVALAAFESLWTLNGSLKGWNVELEELHAATPACSVYTRLEL